MTVWNSPQHGHLCKFTMNQPNQTNTGTRVPVHCYAGKTMATQLPVQLFWTPALCAKCHKSYDKHDINISLMEALKAIIKTQVGFDEIITSRLVN